MMVIVKDYFNFFSKEYIMLIEIEKILVLSLL